MKKKKENCTLNTQEKKKKRWFLSYAVRLEIKWIFLIHQKREKNSRAVIRVSINELLGWGWMHMNEVVATKEYSPRIDWLWPSVCAATRSFASRVTRNGLSDCWQTLCSAVLRWCFEQFPSLRYVDYSTSSFRPFPPSARISRTRFLRGLRSALASETRLLPEIRVSIISTYNDACGTSLINLAWYIYLSFRFYLINVDYNIRSIHRVSLAILANNSAIKFFFFLFKDTFKRPNTIRR